MGLPLLAMFFSATLLLSGLDDLFVGAKQKVEQIVTDKASPGETVSLSTAEVNALFQGGLKEKGVEGVRDAKIDLAQAWRSSSRSSDSSATRSPF